MRIPKKRILELALSAGPDDCAGLYSLFPGVTAPAAPPAAGIVIRHPDGSRSVHPPAAAVVRPSLIDKLRAIFRP
jgi:hypothetical protein